MKEDILHFIWKYQLFDHKSLLTSEKENIEIINPGIHNQNSGPDFLDARIKIANTLWAGNVEIHTKTSDWFAHKHDKDPAYNNVILHVVYQDNNSHKKLKQTNIPTLELKDFLSSQVLDGYYHLMNNKLWIPCFDSFLKTDDITKAVWQNRLIVERLEARYDAIIDLVKKNNNDWLESFYQYLARNFGFFVNSDAFEHLAESTPLKLFSKHKHNLFQIEAILFGQSGLLTSDSNEEYPMALLKEYLFLKNKYDLNGIEATRWRFSKLRPGNFPTIRIAQFGDLLFKSNKLFSHILETESINSLYDYFSVSASSFWDNHFTFNKTSSKKTRKKLGLNSIRNIIINTVIPYIFVYGKEKNKNKLEERALAFLEALPPEKNRILDKWQELGYKNNNAADSQALLHLKKYYCNEKKCLECGIGTKILKS